MVSFNPILVAAIAAGTGALLAAISKVAVERLIRWVDAKRVEIYQRELELSQKGVTVNAADEEFVDKIVQVLGLIKARAVKLFYLMEQGVERIFGWKDDEPVIVEIEMKTIGDSM